jgi:hypothetical protein
VAAQAALERAPQGANAVRVFSALKKQEPRFLFRVCLLAKAQDLSEALALPNALQLPPKRTGSHLNAFDSSAQYHYLPYVLASQVED